MSRFAAFPAPDGLLVLDTVTGEVVLVPHAGGPPVVRRPALASPALALPSVTVPLLAEPPALAPPAAASPIEPADPLDREVVATYPLPIARAYQRFLAEQEPRQRCRLLVDVFTSVLKLWALGIASEHLRAGTASDPQVRSLIVRDFQRPLVSAWNLMVDRGLSALRRAGVTPFTPELSDVYDELERRCREPLVVRVRYEDQDGVVKYKQSKLGRIQALVQTRGVSAFDPFPGSAPGNLPSAAAISNEARTEWLPLLRAGQMQLPGPLEAEGFPDLEDQWRELLAGVDDPDDQSS